ncbi:hypothetical protein BC940DRAFT_294856 [Gongronella butleri]|nr:hypothetical protein BC940DRAFT_294856 [Gongronella butleri]
MVVKRQDINRWLWLTFGFGLGVLFTVTLDSASFFPHKLHHKVLVKRDAGSGNLTSTMLQFGDPGNGRDFLERDSYILSYSRKDRVPSWTGEHLTAASLITGSGVNRDHSQFKVDPDVNPLFQSTLDDYSKSGYDRGHNAPAGDAVLTQQAMDETFYLSNMAPQVGVGFNRQYWAYLEGFVRDLTKSFSDVYVFTGGAFIPKKTGSGKADYTMTYPVLNGNTAVPTHFFKVILVPNGASKYASAAFLLPNQAIASSTDLKSFKVDLSVLEKATGLVFFDKLDSKSLTDLCTITTCTVSKSSNSTDSN